MNTYASASTARYAPARPNVYPSLPPLQTYRVPQRPGAPVTASAAHLGQLEAAKAEAKLSGGQRSTQLKSLVAFFVFWVVVSSLFLLLYVDRMI